jgi:hypothetical protein
MKSIEAKRQLWQAHVAEETDGPLPEVRRWSR